VLTSRSWATARLAKDISARPAKADKRRRCIFVFIIVFVFMGFLFLWIFVFMGIKFEKMFGFIFVHSFWLRLFPDDYCTTAI
jgi:hypothetical protein